MLHAVLRSLALPALALPALAERQPDGAERQAVDLTIAGR
jgi:hypothetical protein